MKPKLKTMHDLFFIIFRKRLGVKFLTLKPGCHILIFMRKSITCPHACACQSESFLMDMHKHANYCVVILTRL